MTELSKLRDDLALVDRDVVRLMAKRQRLVGANPLTDLLVSSALAADFRMRALAGRVVGSGSVGRR